MTPSQDTLYVGLDAGGSSTKLLAQGSPSDKRLTLTGPAGNPKRTSVEAAAQVLAALVNEACEQFPESVLQAICAGVAGAGITSDQETLAEELRQRLDHQPAHLRVTHDAEIALEAAFEGKSGIIIIVGTGSAALARTASGDLQRVGGWGYLLGDEGSGHAVGLMGLRAVAHAFDGGPATSIQGRVAEAFDIDTPEILIHRVYEEAWPVQRVAPLVADAASEGDDVAQRIIADETHGLAQQIPWLVDRCASIEPRIALLGGFAQHPYYRDALRQALVDVLPGWHLQRPMHEPVVGALRLARAAASSN